MLSGMRWSRLPAALFREHHLPATDQLLPGRLRTERRCLLPALREVRLRGPLPDLEVPPAALSMPGRPRLVHLGRQVHVPGLPFLLPVRTHVPEGCGLRRPGVRVLSQRRHRLLDTTVWFGDTAPMRLPGAGLLLAHYRVNGEMET